MGSVEKDHQIGTLSEADLAAIQKADRCEHPKGWEPYGESDERCPVCLTIRTREG